jgi:hypothetical protein
MSGSEMSFNPMQNIVKTNEKHKPMLDQFHQEEHVLKTQHMMDQARNGESIENLTEE